MSTSTFSAQRRYRRARMLYPLTLCYDGGLERVEATGLNEGGLTVLRHKPISVGTKFHLIFELPDGKIIEADGEAGEAIPGIGFGIKFTWLDPQQRACIADAVSSALPETAQLPEQTVSAEQLEEWKKLRAEPRVVMSFAAQIEGQDERGEVFREAVRVFDVSRHGAGLWTGRPCEIGQTLRLIGPGERFTAPVIVRNCSRESSRWRVGVQLLEVPEGWVIS